MSVCFGIDVGGTTIKTGMFGEDGTLLEKWSIPTRRGNGADGLYDDAAEAIRGKLREQGLELADVTGVGIAMPGAVYEDGRMGRCTNLGIEGGDPAAEISRRLHGIPAVLSNDANAAAYGEYCCGAGKGYSSVCMVTLGTGVGGGIIVNGKIITGHRGDAGEIGHIMVEPGETEQCNCGGYGCCEYYSSATGIVRVAKRMAASGDPLKPLKAGQKMKYPESRIALLGDAASAKEIFDLAKEGDPLALRAVDFSMDRLAAALGAVACTVDPEVFIIGGGVSAGWDLIRPRLEERIAVYSRVVRGDTVHVVKARLGNDAGIVGAAFLAPGKQRRQPSRRDPEKG